MRVFIVVLLTLISVPREALAFLLNDIDIHRQTYLEQIRAIQTWERVGGGRKEVIVAILDTGVDQFHPELEKKWWRNSNEIPGNNIDDDGNGYIDDLHGWNFVMNNAEIDIKSTVQVTASHGTVIAGVIGATADNVIGGAGIAFDVSLMPLVILDENGEGNSLGAVRAVRYAVENGASVINLSVVGDVFNPELAEAINFAWRSGVVVVAAAGNEGGDGAGDLDFKPLFPACNRLRTGEISLIAVGSVNKSDRLSDFSDFGSCIDIMAPGENVYATTLRAQAGKAFKEGYSGTSISVAMVSAAAAILKSIDRQLTADQIATALREGADSVDQVNPEFVGKIGVGRLNIFQSLMVIDNFLRSAETATEATIVRLLRTKSGMALQFSRADGFSSTIVPLPDVSSREGWRIATGYWGSASVVRKPLVALFPPAGLPPVARVYDWDGNLQRLIPFGERGAERGLDGTFAILDGSEEGQLILMPRTGLPLLKWFDETGRLRSRWFAGPRRSGSWRISSARPGGDTSLRIGIMSTQGSTKGEVVLFDGFGQRVGIARIPVHAARGREMRFSFGRLPPSFGNAEGTALTIATADRAHGYAALFTTNGKLRDLRQLDLYGIPPEGFQPLLRRQPTEKSSPWILIPLEGSNPTRNLFAQPNVESIGWSWVTTKSEDHVLSYVVAP